MQICAVSWNRGSKWWWQVGSAGVTYVSSINDVAKGASACSSPTDERWISQNTGLLEEWRRLLETAEKMASHSFLCLGFVVNQPGIASGIVCLWWRVRWGEDATFYVNYNLSTLLAFFVIMRIRIIGIHTTPAIEFLRQVLLLPFWVSCEMDCSVWCIW